MTLGPNYECTCGSLSPWRCCCAETYREERERFFFLLALVRAARKSRRASCNVHLYRNPDGQFVASEFIPPRSLRREWLRVRIDGVIEEGASNKRVGTIAELRLG